jgi:hypothetical protein
MIYTFYSYDDGAGRSKALAGVAEHFYQQGLRVWFLDWDVESPGVESSFPQQADHAAIESSEAGAGSMTSTELKARLGPSTCWPTIDVRRRDARASLGSGGRAYARVRPLPRARSFERCRRSRRISSFFCRRDRCRKPLISIGTRSTLPSRQRIFDRLRSQLLEAADVVLIDGPTAVTELGRVCTHLADGVVCFARTNDENAEGTPPYPEHFRSDEFLAAREHRAIETIVIPGGGGEANGTSAEASEPTECRFLVAGFPSGIACARGSCGFGARRQSIARGIDRGRHFVADDLRAFDEIQKELDATPEPPRFA